MLKKRENGGNSSSDSREETLKAGDVLLSGQYQIERFLSAGDLDSEKKRRTDGSGSQHSNVRSFGGRRTALVVVPRRMAVRGTRGRNAGPIKAGERQVLWDSRSPAKKKSHPSASKAEATHVDPGGDGADQCKSTWRR